MHTRIRQNDCGLIERLKGRFLGRKKTFMFSFPGCRSFEEGDTPEDGLPVSENKAESFWLSEHLCCAPVEYMFLLLALESTGTN